MYFPEFAPAFERWVQAAVEHGGPFVVLGHRHADGDCFGAQVAMVRVLRALGLEAFALAEDALPKELKGFQADTPWLSLEQWDAAAASGVLPKVSMGLGGLDGVSAASAGLDGGMAATSAGLDGSVSAKVGGEMAAKADGVSAKLGGGISSQASVASASASGASASGASASVASASASGASASGASASGASASASGAEASAVRAVVVDCSDAARMGPLLAGRFPECFGNFDHHISNTNWGVFNFVDVAAAASCELLAGLFLDAQLPLDAVVAQALYVGLVSDTGQYRFASSSPRTLRLGAHLLDCGASVQATSGALYEQRPWSRQRLLGTFLKALRLELGGALCVGLLRLKDFETSGARRSYSEGFVDYTRDIEGVAVGAFLQELEAGSFKVSLRAAGKEFCLDRLAGHFGGGGHAAAAGFRVHQHLERFYPEFLRVSAEHLEHLEHFEKR